MRQEINLYQPLLRRRKTALSAVAILQVALVSFAALLTVYGYGRLEVGKLERDLAVLKDQRQAASERLAKLEQRIPRQQKSRLLEAELARAEGIRRARSEVIDRLRVTDDEARVGFSPYLAGLARRHVDGTWLTGLRIEAPGGRMRLTGRAVDAGLIPAYLKRLSEEPVFRGHRFNVLRMARDDSTTEPVMFTLATDAEVQK